MTIVKCQTHIGQIQDPMTVRIIANASKQRSDKFLNDTDQDKLPHVCTIVEYADPLTNRRPNSVAYAPLWGKLALAPDMP